MKKIIVALLTAVTATATMAEGRLSANSSGTALSASARVNFRVEVPRILFLRVGGTGDTVNEVSFTVGLAGPLATLPQNNITYDAAIPAATGATTAADDDGTSDGAIGVQLWTNNGSANLDCAGDPLTSGSNTIPLADITVTDGGTLAHPGGTLDCTSTPVGGGGVNNLSDTWTFAYTPTVLPPTGSYSTEITYTASQP